MKRILNTVVFAFSLLLIGCTTTNAVSTNVSDKYASSGSATCVTGSASSIIDNNTEKQHDDSSNKPYLSITETYYTDPNSDFPNDEMESRVFEYDGERVEEKGTVPYNSSYPLTCYSKKDDCIYYIGDAGNRYAVYKKGKDEFLFSNDFCMYNELSHLGDCYFVSAIKSQTSCMKPVIVDLKMKNYKVLLDDGKKDDLQCGEIGVDYDRHILYFSTYSDKEGRKNLNTGKPIYYSIYAYNLDTKKLKRVWKKKKYIAEIAASNGKLYLYLADTIEMNNEEIICINEDGSEETIDLEGRNNKHPYMEVLNGKMYFLGEMNNKRGVLSYDLVTREIKPVLYQNDGEHINNISLNY